MECSIHRVCRARRPGAPQISPSSGPIDPNGGPMRASGPTLSQAARLWLPLTRELSANRLTEGEKTSHHATSFYIISLPPSKPSVLPPPSSEGGLAGGSYPPLRCVTFMGFCRARCPHRAYSCSGSICVPSEDAADSPTWCGSFPLPKDEGVDVVLPLN